MAAQLSIAVVEDSDDLRESLVDLLAALGHRVVGFSCAEDLVDAPALDTFAVMILDLNLPGEDGLTLAMRLKRVQPSLRVIMMTTRTALVDRVRGYDAGADLYLPKPVAEEELLAAVRALGRQSLPPAEDASDRAETTLQFDARKLELRGPAGGTALNATDAQLLSALCRAPDQKLMHWQLLQAIGLGIDDAGKANLAVRVTRLRSKLREAGCDGNALKALRAAGYQLCVTLRIV